MFSGMFSVQIECHISLLVSDSIRSISTNLVALNMFRQRKLHEAEQMLMILSLLLLLLANEKLTKCSYFQFNDSKKCYLYSLLITFKRFFFINCAYLWILWLTMVDRSKWFISVNDCGLWNNSFRPESVFQSKLNWVFKDLHLHDAWWQRNNFVEIIFACSVFHANVKSIPNRNQSSSFKWLLKSWRTYRNQSRI